MRRTLLLKNALRDIRRAPTRYLAMLVMLFLGAYVYIGLVSIGPTLEATLTRYADRLEMADMKIESPTGLGPEDVDRARALPGLRRIQAVPGAAQFEHGRAKVLYVEGLAEAPKLELIRGRLPVAADEVVLSAFAEKSYRLGDELHLDNGGKDRAEPLQRDLFRVVGFAYSPQHMTDSYFIRPTDLGPGYIDYDAWVLPEVFVSDHPATLYLWFQDTAGLSASDPRWSVRLARHREQAEEAFRPVPLAKVQDDMTALALSLAEADRALDRQADALGLGAAQLYASEAPLRAADNALSQGQIEAQRGRAALALATAEAKAQLESEGQKLAEGRRRLTRAERALDTGAAALTQGRERLAAGESALRAMSDRLTANEQRLQLERAQMTARRAQLADGKARLAASQAALERETLSQAQGERTLSEGRRATDKAHQALDTEARALAQLPKGDALRRLESEAAELRRRQGDTAAALTALDRSHAADLSALSQAQADRRKAPAERLARAETRLRALDLAYHQLPPAEKRSPAGLANRLAAGQAKAEREAARLALAALDRTFAEEECRLIDAYEGKRRPLETTLQEIGQRLPTLEAQLAQAAGAAQAERKLDAARRSLAAQDRQWNALANGLAQGRDRLAEARRTLDIESRRLATHTDKLNAGADRLNAGQASLAANRARLEREQASLAEARREIAQRQSQWLLAQGALQSEKERLSAGERAYLCGQKALADRLAAADASALAGRRSLDAQARDLNEHLAAWRYERARYALLYEEGSRAVEQGRVDLAAGTLASRRFIAPEYTIATRKDDQAYAIYSNYALSIRSMAKIFPAFFYLIALLICMTTMLRMIDDARGQLGTLKALGYPNSTLIAKYGLYGALAAVPAALLGSWAATHGLIDSMWTSYSHAFAFRTPEVVVAPRDLAITLGLNLACTVLAAWIATRKSLAESVAALLRPKPPRLGNHILLERLTPLWRRLSFQTKITTRNLFRYKKRSALTILGVAGCTALLLIGFSIGHAVSGLFDLQLGALTRQDLTIVHDAYADDDALAAFEEDFQAAGPLRARARILLKGATFAVPDLPEQKLSVIVPADAAYQSLITLRDRTTGRPIDLERGPVLSEHAAHHLGLKVGDPFTYRSLDGRTHQTVIAAITENYAGHYLYLSSAAYRSERGHEPVANADLVRLPDARASNDFAIAILKNAITQQVLTADFMRDSIDNLLQAMHTIVLIMLLVSMSLALVVLYNLTNINVEERLRELATIKVLGFYRREVSAYIYRETGLLTLIGIAAGLPLGRALERLIVYALSPADFMMDPSIPPASYLYASFFTLLVSLVVLGCMDRKLAKIDMVEALKSVE